MFLFTCKMKELIQNRTEQKNLVSYAYRFKHHLARIPLGSKASRFICRIDMRIRTCKNLRYLLKYSFDRSECLTLLILFWS